MLEAMLVDIYMNKNILFQLFWIPLCNVIYTNHCTDLKTCTILVYMVLNGKGSSNSCGLHNYNPVSFLFLTKYIFLFWLHFCLFVCFVLFCYLCRL